MFYKLRYEYSPTSNDSMALLSLRIHAKNHHIHRVLHDHFMFTLFCPVLCVLATPALKSTVAIVLSYSGDDQYCGAASPEALSHPLLAENLSLCHDILDVTF